nr:hypothetical protein [Streptomonospora litoralis]
MLFVLTGAAISLVTSVVVTWVQSRHVRKSEIRVATRESTRQLTGLFIAEREGALDAQDAEPTAALAEAEMMSVAISDRRTRERMRAVIRLLRELRLPELQELSGAKPAVMRPLLCDHALEVLGAHFRNERLPALPQHVQKMLDVEDEALSIHAGGAPRNAASAIKTSAAAEASAPSGSASRSSGSSSGSGSGSSSGSKPTAKSGSAASGSGAGSASDSSSSEAPAPRGRIRRKQQDTAEDSAKSARRTKAGKGAGGKDDDADDEVHSAFWNDDA